MKVKHHVSDIACAILAGGRSVRMGKDKAVLTLGDRPLINHVYDTVRRVFGNVIILSNHHDHFEGIDAPVLPDLLPMKGAVVGVVSALIYTSAPYVCVLACDMPNLSEKALAYMAGEIHGEDVIIPRTPLGYEPPSRHLRPVLYFLFPHLHRQEQDESGQHLPLCLGQRIEG